MKMLSFFRKIQKKNKGFLLVDAIAALMIVATALGGIAMLYAQGAKSKYIAMESSDATNLASQYIEFLKQANGSGSSGPTLISNLANKVEADTPTINGVEYLVKEVDVTPITISGKNTNLRKVKVTVEPKVATNKGTIATLSTTISFEQ